MTMTINGMLHRRLKPLSFLKSGDIYMFNGDWHPSCEGGMRISLHCPRTYWRPLEESKAMKNRIEVKETYSLADPCCDALAGDFKEGLFTISDRRLTLRAGPRQLIMHVAFCPFCGTEIIPCD